MCGILLSVVPSQNKPLWDAVTCRDTCQACRVAGRASGRLRVICEWAPDPGTACGMQKDLYFFFKEQKKEEEITRVRKAVKGLPLMCTETEAQKSFSSEEFAKPLWSPPLQLFMVKVDTSWSHQSAQLFVFNPFTPWSYRLACSQVSGRKRHSKYSWSCCVCAPKQYSLSFPLCTLFVLVLFYTARTDWLSWKTKNISLASNPMTGLLEVASSSSAKER